MAVRSSRAWPRSIGIQRIERTSSSSMGRLASQIWCGNAGCEGAPMISSPVDSTPTRKGLCTCTSATPRAQSRAISGARSRCPAGKACSPAGTSSPSLRALAPLRRGPLKAIWPASMAQSSSRTTVSTPGGRIAPVRIRTACPAGTVPSKGWPAAARPTAKCITLGPSGAGPAKPYPSTAALGMGGFARCAIAPTASTRPAACKVGTVSTGVMVCRASRSRARAVSTGIQSTP